MGEATVIILHPPPEDVGPLTDLLDDARSLLAAHQAKLFRAAGAARVGIDRSSRRSTFGARLDELAASEDGGLVLLGAGAAPRLRRSDAGRLVAIARGQGPPAMSNNRHSSDVLAVADVAMLRGLATETSDNALPRRLAERGVAVAELPGRERLAMDLDSPLDLAVLCLTGDAPRSLRESAASARLAVPRLAELRAVAADSGAELLVFGRSSARSLAWLERGTACRVRFLAEERGLRTAPIGQRASRSTLGRLLELRGPDALATIVAELADGAILDTRVLMADRFGRDEAGWPSPEDRFSSDLLAVADVGDPWLRTLTISAANAAIPIVLGGHTTVGPGLRPLLGQRVPSGP
ncbi:MAG: hypothetical protein ACHQ02_03500 [Candidatus Limnocylindrales bacterium]